MWVQPLLWVLSRRIEVTAEEVCDDFVVAFGADRGRVCRPSARAGRTAAAVAGAVERGDGLTAFAPGAADRANPRLDAFAFDPGRPSSHRRDLAGRSGGNDPRETPRRRGGSQDLHADEPKPGEVPAPRGDPEARGVGSIRSTGSTWAISTWMARAAPRIVGLGPGASRTVVFHRRGAIWVSSWSSSPERRPRPTSASVVLGPCATVIGRGCRRRWQAPSPGMSSSGWPEGEFGRRPPKRRSCRFPSAATAASGSTIWSPERATCSQVRDRMVLGATARGKMEPQRFKPFELARNLKLEPGQVIDLGTFSAATGQAIKTSAQPTAVKDDQGKVTALCDVPITGRIVDLEGRPIRGVTVQVDSTSKAKGGDLTPWLDAVRRGEPPWVAYQHLEEDKVKRSGQGGDRRPGPVPHRGPRRRKGRQALNRGTRRSPTRTSRL